jgi:hypothetical protein
VRPIEGRERPGAKSSRASEAFNPKSMRELCMVGVGSGNRAFFADNLELSARN